MIISKKIKEIICEIFFGHNFRHVTKHSDPQICRVSGLNNDGSMKLDEPPYFGECITCGKKIYK